MLEIDTSLYQVTSRCVKNRGSSMTSLQSTRKKVLNLQGLLSSQNPILTQAYLPNSAELEARGAQVWVPRQLFFFYGGALQFLVLRMETASPFCHLGF